MDRTQKFVWACGGIAAGLLVGFLALFSGDSPDGRLAFAFDLLGKPVVWTVWVFEKVFSLSKGSSVQLWFLLHFTYWMSIGGLAGWIFRRYAVFEEE